ncbi:Pkinase-domain-containing protein [Wallemia mellicola]|nr:Pkinase-domain-containing protein [Wallemia mellicola]
MRMASNNDNPRVYDLVKPLGEGSFAEVYLVGWKSPKLRLQTGVAAPISQMQINNNRPEYTNKHLVAIKRMKKSFKDWKECEKLKELKSLLAIPQHPNLIPLYDAFLHPTTKELYFVFESMEGNLYQLTKSRRGRPLAQGLVASLFRQTVAGLSHIHRSGYFHRDMKPENLLITTTGLTDYPSLSNSLERDVTVIVKLADFGLARESDSKPPYTEYVSTRWYRAPEVLLRAKDYGPPVDLWALGTILAEIVNLKPLFPGQSEVDQVYKICHVLGNPTSQSTYHPVTNTLIGGGDWQHGLKLAATIGFQFPQVGLQSAAFFY